MKTSVKIIFILSIVILCGSTITYFISRNSKATYDRIKSSNEKLEADLKEKENLINEKTSSKKSLEDSLVKDQDVFKKTYGYDFFDSDNMLSNRVKELNSKNDELKNNIAEVIKKYKKFYDGKIYVDDALESQISEFLYLSDIKTEQISTNLLSVTGINKIINRYNKEGTIEYILSRNPSMDEGTLKMMLFLSIIYSRSLYDVKETGDLPKNLNALRSDIFSLYNLYSEMENLGVNLGELKPSYLKELNDEVAKLLSSYFENKGQIEIIDLGGSNEK